MALALAAGVGARPVEAHAHARTQVSKKRARASVEVAKIEMAPRADEWRVEQLLRGFIKKSVKAADFGSGAQKKLVLKTRLVALVHEKRGDVVRVSCTVVGKLEGGQSAKSHIRYGGRPEEAAKLEKQVLEMVARGLVARLAAMSREAGEDYDAPEALQALGVARDTR